MPLYEYECEACGKHFELIRKFSDPPVETCFACGGPVRKLLSSPAIQFKGTGWYITDYARKSSAPSGPSESGNGNKPESSASVAEAAKDAKPAESSSTTKS